MSNETQIQTTEKKQMTIRDFLASDKFKEQVALALPKHCTADRFARVALTALNRTPKLAECTHASLLQCFMDLSAMGLEADGRRAHLIPYGDKATLVIDYKGLVELAIRSGEISTIHADVVCENDDFVYNMGKIDKHEVDFKTGRGKMYAAYAHVVMKDGSVKDEVMSKEEIDAIRARSRSANSGPWVTDYNEMAKKTAFRRCSKWLPLSAELRDNIEKDDEPLNVTPQPARKDPLDPFTTPELPAIAAETAPTS